MIAEEVIGIHVDMLDDSTQSQLNDTPIMPGGAAATGLPSVHPFATVGIFIGNEDSATRLEEILLLGEELIVCEKRDAADTRCGKIDKTSRRGYY